MSTGRDSPKRKDKSVRLDDVLAECARLRAENARLKALLGYTVELEPAETPLKTGAPADPGPLSRPTLLVGKVNGASAPAEKVALFRDLFRGREDVYPVRWENKSGRSGYAPACAHDSMMRWLFSRPTVLWLR